MKLPIIIQLGNSRNKFDSIGEAAEHISHYSVVRQRLEVPLGKMLMGSIMRSQQGHELVYLRSWGQETVRPRKTAMQEGDLTVVEDGRALFGLIAMVYEYDNPLFQRGIASVVTGRGQWEHPRIVFNTKPQRQLSTDEIHNTISHGVSRAQEFVETAFTPISAVPYAEYSARSQQLMDLEEAGGL